MAGVQGENIEAAAINEARVLIHRYAGAAGDDALVAFDLGLAVGTGKGLQEAGFAAVYRLIPVASGSDYTSELAGRISSFVEAGQTALRTGQSVKDVLLSRVVDTANSFSGIAGEAVGSLRAGIAQMLQDDEPVPEKQLANLAGDALASRLSSLLSRPVSTLEANVLQACIQQITVTQEGATSSAPSAAPGGASISINTSTKTIVVANDEVCRRVFIRAMRAVPTSAVQSITTQILVSQKTAGVSALSVLLTPGSEPLALVALRGRSRAGERGAADAALDYERARSLVLRGQWVAHYHFIEARVTKDIQSGRANPFSITAAIQSAVATVSADRRYQMTMGSMPQSSAEQAWYFQTFGGYWGDPAADNNRSRIQADYLQGRGPLPP
jgi:hypothetical protein